MTHIYAIRCLHKIWYLGMGTGHLFIIQREKKQKQQQKQTNEQNNFNFALSRGRGIPNQPDILGIPRVWPPPRTHNTFSQAIQVRTGTPLKKLKTRVLKSVHYGSALLPVVHCT